MRRYARLLLAFLAPALLGTIGSVFGIASGINSLMGGGGGSSGGGYAGGTGTSMPFYVPTGQATADQAWLQALSQIQGADQSQSGAVSPQLLQAYSQLLGIDPSQLLSAGANAGQQYTQAGQMAQGGAGALMGNAGQLYSAGQQAYNLGADPQSALYAKQYQQMIDQSNAINSMYGLGSSGAGAGITDQNAQNFNMNWENQQLQRQLSGLSGLQGASQVAGADINSAGALAGTGAGYTLAGGTTPITAQQTGYGLPIQASNLFSSAMQGDVATPYANLQSNIIPYLNYGTGAGSNAFNAGLAQTQQQNAQQASGVNAILSGLNQGQSSGLGSWLSNMMGFGGAAPQTSANGYGTGQADFSAGYY